MDEDKIEDGSHCHVTESIGKTKTINEKQELKCLDNDVADSPLPRDREGNEAEIRRLQKSKKMLTLLALLLVHFLGLMDL
jgi:hypothetical protein